MILCPVVHTQGEFNSPAAHSPVHLQRHHLQSPTFPSASDNTRVKCKARQRPNTDTDNIRGTYLQRHCYVYAQTWRVYICIRVREKEKEIKCHGSEGEKPGQEGRERSVQPEQLHPFDLTTKQHISQASQRNFFHFCFECCKLARQCIKPKKSVAPGLGTVLYAQIIMDFLIYALLYLSTTSATIPRAPISPLRRIIRAVLIQPSDNGQTQKQIIKEGHTQRDTDREPEGLHLRTCDRR